MDAAVGAADGVVDEVMVTDAGPVTVVVAVVAVLVLGVPQ